MDQELSSPALETLTQEEIERLMAQMAEQEMKAVIHQSDGARKQAPRDAIQPYDFRLPTLLSANEHRKLRAEHDTFVRSLAARLSIYLRMEFGLQLVKLETVPYQKWVSGLVDPTHISLFKVEPLRGICLLEIPPRLGLTIVDRLMGGTGHAASLHRDLSEIEVALLDQAIQIMLNEWCTHWAKVIDLQPALLGHENSGRFLQTAPMDTVMLVLGLEARLGDCREAFQIAFPYHTLEPLMRHLNESVVTTVVETKKPAPVAAQWHSGFDDIKVAVTAEWPEMQLSARELTRLKVGDVLEWDPEMASQVRLRLANTHKFVGRLGTQAGKWAIEITAPLKPDSSK